MYIIDIYTSARHNRIMLQVSGMEAAMAAYKAACALADLSTEPTRADLWVDDTGEVIARHGEVED